MQKQNIHYKKTIPALLATLILACLGLAPATQAAGHHSIVGMWSVHYVSTTGGPEVFTFDQWHNDGLEFEAANLIPGALCQGHTSRRRMGAIITTMSPGRSILPARQAATGTKTWSSVLVPMARVTRGLSLKTSMM